MPVHPETGRWESWDARETRLKADAPEVEEEPSEAPKPQGVVRKATRRGAAAAQAAIAEATGVEVNLDADIEAEVGLGEDFTEEQE